MEVSLESRKRLQCLISKSQNSNHKEFLIRDKEGSFVLYSAGTVGTQSKTAKATNKGQTHRKAKNRSHFAHRHRHIPNLENRRIWYFLSLRLYRIHQGLKAKGSCEGTQLYDYLQILTFKGQCAQLWPYRDKRHIKTSIMTGTVHLSSLLKTHTAAIKPTGYFAWRGRKPIFCICMCISVNGLSSANC